MTPDEQVLDGNEPPPVHIEIDALLDGEAVDKHALRAALDDAAARDYLVDALMLRQWARDMEPGRFVAAPAPRGSLMRRAHWLAAGAILVVGASVGYVYGHQFNSALASPGSVEVALGNTPAPPAPEPTRLIRFEPGVNWTSDTRSH